MKKTILLIACIAMLFFTGCADNEEPFIQENYTTEAAQAEHIIIDVRDRLINVTPSNDDQIHISYYQNNKEYYEINLSNDKILTIEGIYNKEWMDFIGKITDIENRTITLNIPNNLIDELYISTTNEDVSLSDIEINNNITIVTNGSNIFFDKINVYDSITLNAKNGNITGTIIGGYDDYAIFCNVKKGNCNLPYEKQDGSKTLNVTVNNGDIEIDFIKK